jgi:hypothetical protein
VHLQAEAMRGPHEPAGHDRHAAVPMRGLDERWTGSGGR